MNLIIVESKNDKAFVNAIVEHLNLQNTRVDSPIILEEEDYVLLDGIDSNSKKPTILARKIKEIKTDIIKKSIEKIGIILDLDSKTEKDRIEYLNNAIKNAFSDVNYTFSGLKKVNESVNLTYLSTSVEFVCYFTNYAGKGELETVLKTIATKDSTHADCLEAWKVCIEKKGKEITDKDFDKFWVSNYLRFDTCTESERKQAGRKCSFAALDYVLKNKKGIFDFNSSELTEIKKFLGLFQ